MPIILRDALCPSCGQRHTFTFPDTDAGTSRVYRYVCPKTDQPTSIRPETTAEIARQTPQGAVPLVPG